MIGGFVLEKIKKFYRGISAEMKRIIWPTKQVLVKNTCVSLGVILASSAVLFLFDRIGQAFVRLILMMT